jgi:hypothetical protein
MDIDWHSLFAFRVAPLELMIRGRQRRMLVSVPRLSPGSRVVVGAIGMPRCRLR